MQFKQKVEITSALRGPFFLTKVPISLQQGITRTKFRCPYAAVRALREAKFDPKKWYGGEVSDNNGTIIAEVEIEPPSDSVEN